MKKRKATISLVLTTVVFGLLTIIPSYATENTDESSSGFDVIYSDNNSITVRNEYILDRPFIQDDLNQTVEFEGVKYNLSSFEPNLIETITNVGKEKHTQEVTTSVLSKEEFDFDEKIQASYNGVNYEAKLVSTYFSPVSSETGNSYITTHATGTTTYPKQTTEPSVPQQKEFIVKNDITGEEENRVLNLDRVEATEKSWGDEETLEFEFQSYSAEKYDIGGNIFYHDDENCPLNTDIDIIYDMLGLNRDDYQMIRAEWDGKANKKNDTRKALIYYKRRTSTYVAYYSADVTFVGNEEHPTTYIGHGIYEFEVGIDNGIRYKYEVISVYTAEEDESSFISAETVLDSSESDSKEDSMITTEAVTEITSMSQLSETHWSAAKTIAVGGGTATILIGGVSVFVFMSYYVVVFDSKNKRLCSCKIGNNGKINVIKAAVRTGDIELLVKATSPMSIRMINKFGNPIFCLNARKTLEYEIIDNNIKIYKVYLRRKKEVNSND